MISEPTDDKAEAEAVPTCYELGLLGALEHYHANAYKKCIAAANKLLTDPALPPYQRMKSLLLISSATEDWYVIERCRLELESTWYSARRDTDTSDIYAHEALKVIRGDVDDLKTWQQEHAPVTINKKLLIGGPEPRRDPDGLTQAEERLLNRVGFPVYTGRGAFDSTQEHNEPRKGGSSGERLNRRKCKLANQEEKQEFVSGGGGGVILEEIDDSPMYPKQNGGRRGNGARRSKFGERQGTVQDEPVTQPCEGPIDGNTSKTCRAEGGGSIPAESSSAWVHKSWKDGNAAKASTAGQHDTMHSKPATTTSNAEEIVALRQAAAELEAERFRVDYATWEFKEEKDAAHRAAKVLKEVGHAADQANARLIGTAATLRGLREGIEKPLVAEKAVLMQRVREIDETLRLLRTL